MDVWRSLTVLLLFPFPDSVDPQYQWISSSHVWWWWMSRWHTFLREEDEEGREEKAGLDPFVITSFSEAKHATCHCLSCSFPPPPLSGVFLVAYHDQEAGSSCSKEILIPLLLHLKAKMTNFSAMLHYTGIKEQKGEGQWLHGVLIRCRSA